MNVGICKVCGKKTEYKYKSWIKECCSHKCSNILKWENRPKAEQVRLICKICKEEFLIPKSDHRLKKGVSIKYCSHKCMGIDKRTRTIRNCEYCNEKFESTRKYPRGRFCSSECFQKHKSENYKHTIYDENGYNVMFINGYNKKGNVKEHRFIMEEYLGRRLQPTEVVHHKNGNKKDNRIENLEVMTLGEHSKLHRELEMAQGKELFGR